MTKPLLTPVEEDLLGYGIHEMGKRFYTDLGRVFGRTYKEIELRGERDCECLPELGVAHVKQTMALDLSS